MGQSDPTFSGNLTTGGGFRNTAGCESLHSWMAGYVSRETGSTCAERSEAPEVPSYSFHTFAAVSGAGVASNPQSYPQQYPPPYPLDIHALGIGCDTYGVP